MESDPDTPGAGSGAKLHHLPGGGVGGPTGPGHAATASFDSLARAVEALRARIDEEFRISERLAAKQRQALAISAGFFVVAQAVALGSFAPASIGGVERIFVLILAVAASVAAAVAAWRARQSEALLTEHNIDPEEVKTWARDSSIDPSRVLRELIGAYATIAQDRHQNNVTRRDQLERTDNAVAVSLILTTVELLTALAFRF